MSEYERIGFFIREEPYGFLSNFWRSPIEVDGLTYPTVEHCYQAMKVDEKYPEIREWIRTAPNASCAKAIGDALNEHFIMKKYKDPDWSPYKKLIIMKAILGIKFENPILRAKLLETYPSELYENNPKDTYWGIGDGHGQNMLGNLLMKVRAEIIEESK